MSNTLDALNIEELRANGIDYKEAGILLAKALEELGVTIDATFVPFNISRAKDDKYDNGRARHSIQWKIDIKRKSARTGIDSCIMAGVEYGQGVGLIPGYSLAHHKCAAGHMLRYCAQVTRTGLYVPGKLSYEKIDSFFRGSLSGAKRLPAPSASDVMSSLLMDSSALDYSGFEDWASSYGYDTDSIKATNIYRECVSRAVALRAEFGNVYFEKLVLLANSL